MRYAFMSFSCPELTLDQMIELAGRLGYDALEPRLQAEHRHGITLESGAEARRTARDTAADAGVPFCCLAVSCRFADPKTSPVQVDQTMRCIDLAADIGAARLRVFGGPIGDGIGREQAVDLLVASLSKVADHAQQHGVTVCVETHDDWCDPSHLAAVMRTLSHPAIAVNWDIMHPVITAGWTMRDAYETLRPWIRHVHFHDGRPVTKADRPEFELVPIGQGAIDHLEALRCLKQMNYDGYLSGEWIGWEPCETHLPRELANIKQLEAQLG